MPSVEAEWHRIQAIDANNATWELLDGRALTADEADDLLGRAYAATYHWQRAADATPVNAARAAWLVSRAHAVLGQGDLALHHAQRSAAHVGEAGDLAADFDHAYAHEATARALACLGRLDEARAELALANAVEIADPEDRSIVEADIKSEPWYGLLARHTQLAHGDVPWRGEHPAVGRGAVRPGRGVGLRLPAHGHRRDART